MEADVGLQEPDLRLSDRDENAGEAAARAAGRQDQLLCAGVAVLLFLRDVHPVHDSWYRSASHELLLSSRGVLCLPPAAGLPGGSHLDPQRLCDLLGSLDLSSG